MKKVLFSTMLGLVLLAFGCGDDCKGLCGSQCDNIDCAWDTLYCQRDATTNPDIKIDYKLENSSEGSRWAAQIIFEDMNDLPQVEGHRFEGEEFLKKVVLRRPGESQFFPALSGNYCEIKKGGDQLNQPMQGICGFRFVSGTFMTAEFSCLLKPSIY